MPIKPMIKALIIEDEEKAANLLEIMLAKTGAEIEVVAKCNDLPSGVRSIKKFHPEIIFLDIEMPGYSGLQLLEFFNPEEIDFSIVFTTAFNDYAIRAFELSAIDYLLKPIQIDKLKLAVERFLRVRNKELAMQEKLSLLQNNLGNNGKKMVVPLASGLEIIRLEDILYLQADGSYTKIFLHNGNMIHVSKNLKYFEDQLSKERSFQRIHRSYLLNTEYIKKVTKNEGGNIILENGTILPIVPDKIDELIESISL